MVRRDGAGITVGREEERTRILDVVASARRGSTGAILVAGEVGIGKTTLAREAAADAASRGMPVLWGTGDPIEADRPFGPLAAALDLDPQSPDPDRAALGALLGDAPSGGVPVLAVNIPEMRYRVIEALSGLVEGMAAAAPTLLVVDDVHWADRATVQALTSIVRRVNDVPLAVLATTRTTGGSRLGGDPVDAYAAACNLHLVLGPLDGDDVERLVLDALGARPGPRLVAMLAGAGGNPLLASELVRSLHDEDTLVVADGTVEVRPGATVRDFGRRILARAGDLPDDAVLLVQVGAVLGSTFTLDEAAAVTGLSLARALPALREAQRSGLLASDDGRLTFRHDLLRRVIYDDITPDTRGALHREAGRRLAEHGAAPARVARHLAAGAVPGDAAAVEWLHRAARDAGSKSPTDTLDLLSRAIELAGPDHPRRVDLQADLVKALGWVGDPDRAESVARELLDEATDLPLRRALHRQVSLSRFVRNRAREAAAVCDESAAEQHDETARARARAEAALAHLAAGDPGPAAERATSAVRVGGRAGDPVSVCLGQSVLSRIDAFDLDLASSLARAETAVAVAADDPTGDAVRNQPGFFLILTLLDLDRFDDAVAVLRRERRSAAAQGTVWAVPLHHASAAVIHLLQGELSDAATEAEAGLDTAADVGSHLASIWLRATLALTALHAGDEERAAREVEEAKNLLATHVPLLGIDLLVLAEAAVHEQRGAADAARDVLVEGWKLFDTLGMGANLRLIGADIARLAAETDDRELGAAVLEALEGIAARTHLPGDEGSVHLARGLLEGDPEELAAAIAAYERSPRLMRLGRAHELMGRYLWRTARPGDATVHLEIALSLYADVGAEAGTRRVTRTVSDLGLTRRRTRPKRTGPAGLTRSEARVVALVGEGLSNQAIADTLAVSRRTVETHLSHVYAKLGISSRVELALRASETSSPTRSVPSIVFRRRDRLT